MYVAGSGRQVDQQEIERSPQRLADHLPQRVGRHRAAPHQRVGRVDEKSDRHDPDSEPFGRKNPILAVFFFPFRPVVFDAEQHRLGRPVNIGVQNAYFISQTRQGDRQVRRNGAFAHSAFCGTDGKDATDAVLAAERFLFLFFGGFFRRGFLDEDADFPGIIREPRGDQFFAALLDR